jgi:hypothetical protein
MITWACWTAGWWTNNVLDAAGVPTAQYAKLKKVNAELKRLGPEYMKFRSTATHFVGFASGSPRNPKEPVPYPAALDAGFLNTASCLSQASKSKRSRRDTRVQGLLTPAKCGRSPRKQLWGVQSR